VKKMSSVTAEMIMSCGQKIWPRMINFRSRTLSNNNGLPWMRTNGPTNISVSSNTLTHVLAVVNRPFGLRG